MRRSSIPHQFCNFRQHLIEGLTIQEPPTENYAVDPPGVLDILQWIGVQDHQIGNLADVHRPQ